VHKNPQTVQLPGAEPLHAEALQKFRRATAPLLADLSPQQAAPAAVAAAAGPAGPLANDPAVSSVFSVSSVLHDSTFISNDDRSRMSVN
jgi:hypothetical protein